MHHTPSNIKQQHVQNDTRIEIISSIVLVGFALAVFFHYINGSYLGLTYPHDTFLFKPSDRFNDFFHMINICKNLNPYFEPYLFQSNYFPFANLIFYVFSLIEPVVSLRLYSSVFILFILSYLSVMLAEHQELRLKKTVVLWLILLIVLFFPDMNHSFRFFWMSVVLGVLILYYRGRNIGEIALKHYKNIFILGLLTYPILFCLDRGNIEMFLLIFLGLFSYFYYRKQVLLGAFFLGLAISLKLYPAVFVVLLISDKKYKACIWSLCVAAGVTLLALLLFKGGFWANIIYIISGFNTSLWSGFFELNGQFQRGVSLYSLFKMILLLTISKTGLVQAASINMGLFLKVYTVIAFLIFIFISIYILLIETERWKKMSLLVFSMLLLPHFSADYRLIHLFIPIVYFINSRTESSRSIVYSLLFALLLIPKNYYYFQGFYSDSGFSDIGKGMVLNILGILLLMGLIMMEGLASVTWIDIKNRFRGYVASIPFYWTLKKHIRERQRVL